MAKKTIVKNGKRVPASEKGKAKKPPPEDKKKAKAEQSRKIAQAVWKATEAHKSTIGKLAGLVDTYDEYDAKAETLKEQICGIKGMLAEDKAEIRRIAHLVNSPDHPTVEQDMKSLAGLERDCERREVKLAGLSEERSGAKEAMKCAMADIRKIVKLGPGLFEEKGAESGPTGAGKAGSASSTSKSSAQTTEATAPSSAPGRASQNTTPPPSTSPDAPAGRPRRRPPAPRAGRY